MKVKSNFPECVEELIYLRRSNNSTYALACTLRGSGQGVVPYMGDKLEKFSVEGLYVSGALDTKYTTIGRIYLASCQTLSMSSSKGRGIMCI